MAPAPDRKALRAAARARRRGADPAAALVACRAALAGPLAGCRSVAAYWPLGDELDVRPLLLAVADRGVAALPVVPVTPGPLLFRRWHPGRDLVPGRLGTREPPQDAETVIPEALVVPLLAFDRRGGRLGQGGGYYDRTLAALRQGGRGGMAARVPVMVGMAFACQEIPNVPMSAHDQPLDWVVTESGALNCRELRICG